MKLPRLKHPTYWLESKPVLAWSLAVIYAALIFYLSSFPYAPPEPGFAVSFPSSAKHIAEYLILGFLLLACFRSSHKTKPLAFLLAVLFAAFYGATDELHQLFVPYRVPSLFDIIADAIGGFFGAVLANPKLFNKSSL